MNRKQIKGYIIMFIGMLSAYIIEKQQIRYNIGYISIVLIIIGFYIVIYNNKNINIELKEG